MLPCSAWRKEEVGGLPDNCVSGGISHVAMQLDVQRESAMQRVQISRRRGHVVTCIRQFWFSPASPQYRVFICIWRPELL